MAIVLRQGYLMKGSLARVLSLFAWVAVDIVLWGFISRYLGTIGATGLDFVAVFLGAVLLWDFFMRVMQGVTMAFFEDVWSRNFLNFFASPLSISEYVGGLVLTSVATSSAGLTVMIVLASAVFHLSFFAYGLPLLAFLFALFVFGIALGVFACAMVLRFGPAFEWFIWPIPAIISPFAGVFYPISTLPAWMQVVAHALPPAYVFESMRAIVGGHSVSVMPLVLGGGLSVVYLLLAAALFVRMYRHSVRTGLIARYSAETVN
jgi:ABC-2 type transport system permease protein